MAIQRVSGNILQDNLQRGANLSIQGNLAYFDVTNNRVGILTSSPQDEFNVIGVANASNVRITSATANGVFYAGNTLLALTNSGFTYDGTNVDVVANLTAGNLISEGAVIGNVEISGNLVVVNLTVTNTLLGNIISASGNVTGANIISNGVVQGSTANITGNITGGNVSSGGIVSATGNITGGNLVSNASISAATTISATGNITGGNIISNAGIFGTTANITGNITGGNASISGLINVTGNITGGNLISNAGIFGTTVTVTGNASVGNLTITSTTANRILYTDSNKNVATTNNLTFDGSSLVLTGTANVSANLFAGNVYSAGLINAVGNITGANVVANGNVNGNNFNATKELYVGGNAIIDGNLTINGDLVYENVTTLAVEDPIISMGRGANNTPLVANDGKDRGEQLWYFSGSEKSAFIGYDNSAGNLIAAVDVAIANEIVTVNQYGTWQVGNIYAQSALITGNVSFGNISTTGQISATGNITGGNLVSNAMVSAATTVNATGNITGGNLVSNASVSAATTISATGNITGGNLVSNASVSAATTVSATGNITGGNLVSNAAISAATTVNATGNITGGNLVSNASISAATTVSATGNITGGNLVSNAAISAATTVSANGNVTGGNLISNARITGTTLDIYGDALVAGNLTVQGNLTYINIDDLRVEDPIIQLGGGANGNALVTNDGKDRGTLLTYYTTAQGNAFVGWDNSSGNMIVASNVAIANEIITVNQFGTFQAGNVWAESAVIVGNVSLGNVSTPGQINATGNISGGNLISNANISAASFIFATANIVGGNLVSNANISAASAISATGNITGGNLVSNANISAATAVFANGNITGGNIISNGFVSVATTVSATGNITGGNLVSNAAISAASTISATGNITGGNIVSNALVTGANVQVTSLTPNRIVYVGANDYLVDTANLNFDGANLVLIGSANIDNIRFDGTTITSNANLSITATSGNLLLTPGSTGVTQISSTTALTMPVGNTAQRPASPDQGAVRFNSTTLVLEVWDGTQWDVVGQDLAILTSQIINGDGTTTVFSLNETTTSGGILVSINGVSQIPDQSYGVVGNVITFSEAPQVSDAVEVRFLTQIQTVTEITNTAGNSIVGVQANASQVNITGNLLPTANVTYNLGSPTLRWKDGYFSGNSITLGNIILKNTSGNTLAFFGPDGTTPGTLSSNNVDTTQISNGTSNVQTLSSGSVTVGAGGNANVVIVSNGSVTIKGDLLNGQANGVGNIGNSSTYFNTIFAKATSAQYADLAEYFEADQEYDTGTVMIFGSNTEITQSTQYADQRLAGIVSTDPAFVMNATQPNSLPIAMAGRVPCWVIGPVAKGDILTTSSTAGHAEKLSNSDWKPGVVVGKSLESVPAGQHKIMVVVGAW